jgi:fatty-acyl-CoA synthase
MTLDWLEKWNLYSPEGIALKDGDSLREISYSKFYDLACKGAAFLKKNFKISSGDRIAVLAQNELDYVVLFFAAQRLGAILVPINYRLTDREIGHILEDCDAKVLVTGEEYSSLSLHPQNLAFTDFSRALETEQDLHKSFNGGEESPVMILYTSGTTGAPKGAVLTHKMLFWNSINTSLRLNISQSDSAVIFLPLFHTGGWNVLTTPFFHRGAKIILLKKFDAELILSICEREKCTLLFGVPTTMDMMSRSPNFPQSNLSSLRYAIVGGEPMPVNLIETWHNKKVPIRQGYGLTEFGPNVFSLNEQDAIRKIGSIGFPNFYSEARIVDETGEVVKTGEVGELILRGPMCMQGYWRNEKATAETIVDGWLHTGDLVRSDLDGYHYVVGRKKDMYKSGGENVYPAELEKVLRDLSGIREAAVIGVPDSKWGEVGKAFIVLEKDAPHLTEKMIAEHCTKNLAKFKIPKYFQFLPELPKGDSGKILKRKLVELV